MIPSSGLSVNGAGDIYAAQYIKNYFNYDIIKASTLAMRKTTEYLLENRK